MSLISEAKDIFAKTIEKVPNLTIVLGAVSLFLSYFSYDKTGFHFPTANYKLPFLIFGGAFILLGIVLHFILRDKQTKKLKNKTILKFGSTTLIIKIASIQDETDLKSDSAFILPANTTFADDCVTDSKSALGSFFKTHHEEKVPTFNQELKNILQIQGIQASSDGDFAPSTVVILPEAFSIKSKVILVASSMRSINKGFHTNPSIISNSIYNIFKATSDRRINTFYFPILGSGHAGLEITEALNLLILCIKFSVKEFNHIKNVVIFVRQDDSKKINAAFLNSFL